MGIPVAPTPRRLSRPKWLNVRVVGGILLVIAAVVVGARVVGASSQTAPVWTAGRDLAVGTVLGPDDLTAADVNLGTNTDLYLTTDSASLIGRTVITPLSAGELLAASAVEESAAGRVVAIGVEPDNMPPGVDHGSTVDLYLTTGGGAGAESTATTELIGRDLTVQSLLAPASGGLSGATSNRYQLSVLLAADSADRLVRILPTGNPIVVLVSG
ncbi:SAF domain-containing protein [Nakamurella sp. GG22]